MNDEAMTPAGLRRSDRYGRARAAFLLMIRNDDAGPLTALEDPNYSPRTLPTDGGGIPSVVEHWWPGESGLRQWLS